MRNDNYPAQASDPESEGLPGTADDDSNAYDEVDTGRPRPGGAAVRPSLLPDAFGRRNAHHHGDQWTVDDTNLCVTDLSADSGLWCS